MKARIELEKHREALNILELEFAQKDLDHTRADITISSERLVYAEKELEVYNNGHQKVS